MSSDRAALPTQEQLLTLVNRTDRHVLTAGEVHLLRVGVTHREARLARAGETIRTLTAERDTARVERDAARRELALSGAQVVACPYCDAAAGVKCRATRGGAAPATPHTARLTAASKWQYAQTLGKAS